MNTITNKLILIVTLMLVYSTSIAEIYFPNQFFYKAKSFSENYRQLIYETRDEKAIFLNSGDAIILQFKGIQDKIAEFYFMYAALASNQSVRFFAQTRFNSWKMLYNSTVKKTKLSDPGYLAIEFNDLSEFKLPNDELRLLIIVDPTDTKSSFYIDYLALNTKKQDSKLTKKSIETIEVTDKKLDEVTAPNSFPSWMQKPIHSSQFTNADIGLTKIKQPSHFRYIKDKLTNKKVWRLGGTTKELNSLKKHTQQAWTELHSQHYYSRTHPTNKSETYALSSASYKLQTVALYKIKPNLELVADVPAGTGPLKHFSQRQVLWDKKEENVYWYCDSNKLVRVELNLSSKPLSYKQDIVKTFNNYDYITFGHGEGDFSDDGNRIALIGVKSDDNLDVIPFSISDTKVGDIKSIDATIDWVSVDPSGQYIVLSGLFSGLEKNYSASFEKFSQSPMIQIFDDLKHSDFVLDHYGDSWLVNSDWRGIFASRLKDGRVKKIWPRAEELIEKGKSKSLDGKPVDKPPYVTMSGHISRVSSIPGLILVYRHFDGGMYFIDIDEPEWTSYAGNAYLGPRAPEGKNGRMESQPWGITSQGEVTWYYREPRASSSQSGEFIFFNSDFGYYDNYSPEPPLKAFTHIIDMNSSID